MVFKPINLARSVISKTFPNGYAQSLVAATQSSSATHPTHFSTFHNNVVNYFGKPAASGSTQSTQQHGHQNAAGNANKNDVAASGGERGLDAYYAAWHKHHRAEDKEWHQFQFAKRIGWKAPTTIPEPHLQAQAVPVEKPVAALEVSDRPPVHRAKSASAVDDIKNTEQSLFAESTVVQDASAQEFDDARSETEPFPALQPTKSTASITSASPQSLQTFSPVLSTLATSVSEADQYIDHLTFLAENQRHAEIPAVFESMLSNSIRPTATAYNALLLAAIHLPKGKHQVVPKVLDVYTDMLRRRITPDTATYGVLIEVLAARALDVRAMKDDLLQKRVRYAADDKSEHFLLASDETEYKILEEDDSLSLAIRLFDTAAAVKTLHSFPSETYRLLITACAEQARINDMVRIYAEMESQEIVPPSAIFAPMIEAFAMTGDLRSSVECYEEYKALAVAHDNGLKSIARKDEDVYAAVVKAYALCDQTTGGLKFLGKVEESMQGSERAVAIRDAVATQALIPQWIAQHSYAIALAYAVERVSPEARAYGLQAICADAASKNEISVANEAFTLLTHLDNPSMIVSSAYALMAAHVRRQDFDAARLVWEQSKQYSNVSVSAIEPATVLANAFLENEKGPYGLVEARQLFARVRDSVSSQQKPDSIDRIEEAISVIGQKLFSRTSIPSSAACLELVQMMVENDTVSYTLAESLLAPLGPQEIATLSPSVLCNLMQVQAGLLVQRPEVDVGHLARFLHILDLTLMQGSQVDKRTSGLVEKVLGRLERPDLSNRWHSLQYPVATPLMSPMQYSPPYASQITTSPTYDDTFDPYAASTDFKGSAAIVDELEKSYGRHSAHLNEALIKFKNMRRIGRHPRYTTYAKLIGAAAKENRLNLAHDILAMARQDVPLLPNSRVVTQGWASMLDAMVGACLTVGKRDAAAQFHQDLISMGAAPSANTFGLYITTLKDSTKTFDEATEAVKIFHRAKTEGVEPTSFLYNALIGKLGKARRIDDCLFYFAEMRNLGIRPTSVTYGTIVNALCRVSDDRFAEELFEEMESMPNYKPRPAPFNSLMQYFLTTKRDRTKVLAYYDRMRTCKIEPTMHTYKLLIDTHATLEPIDLPAAEAVLADIRRSGARPEAVHYASLIHAKGCVLHDLAGARAIFDSVIAEGHIPPQASLYQAMFESMVANHDVADTEALLQQMSSQRVSLTPYIANTLIHGWALVKEVNKARAVYDTLGMEKREPSTYEAMTRAYLAVEEHGNAMGVVGEALRRGYPAAVANKICDLVGGGSARV